MLDLSGLPTYTVGDAASKTAIVVLADVFGFDCGRHFNIADQLASLGFYVVMPDLFHGDRLTWADIGQPRFMEFINSHPHTKWAADMDSVYAHLKEKGSPKTGLMGFCWGSWAIFHESARGAPIVSGVNFHPSLGIEGIFERDPVALAEKCAVPQLLLPCKDDPEMVQEGGGVWKALQAKPFGSQCEIHKYEDNNHGFVSQGDVSKPETARDVEDAVKRAIAFLEKTVRA